MSEDPWYSERRARWKPERVRILLIAESAPDDGGDIANRRFFYEDKLTGQDGLFREVVRALYDNPTLTSGPNAKKPWLEKLKADGVFLIDLAPVPVNYHSPSERAAALQRNIEATISHASRSQRSVRSLSTTPRARATAVAASDVVRRAVEHRW